jgi:glutaredoxin 3
MSKITLYTTDRCSSCLRAKALLTQRALPFEEINLSRDPDGREQLAERTGLMTFPQILIGEHTVGGFEALAAADRDGRLLQLLAA